MAILVAVGGAALGSAIGVGWQAGWLVGSVVGSLLFPAKGQNVTTEGPRLGDLTVSSSAYGASIPIGYGTLRMAGNMIWSSGIREQQNVTRTRSGGKGGGGSTQTSISYSYFASFALSFGEGPAEDVLRIWADGKLIYDKTGSSPDVAKPSLRFRFYPGNDTQLPDPLIEAHVGAGRAPAHRGLCVIVFEDLALADYGNRIPNITAEITYRRAAEQPHQLIDFITPGEGGYFDSYQIDELAIDWRRGYGYFLRSNVNASAAGIRRFSEQGAQVYDAVTDTHLVRGSNGWARLFLNRGGGEGEALSAIVADLCGRAGLGLADIDVAELTPSVPGYVIGRQTTVRGAIEPLAQAYFFDAAESDDTLRFRTRGRAPVATIGAELLVPLDDRTGESWRERRTQEVELPERVAVVYMDRDADYQQGTQSEKRASLPLATMHSRNQASLELALAIDATTAKRIAAKTLYSAWIERSQYEGALPPDFLALDPTDVVDVVFPSGSAFRTRITRLDVGADFSLALKGVSETAATYVSTAEADGGSGRPPQAVGGDAATRLILPDLPLLRDVDDAGGAGSRLYYLMAGFGNPGWPGAALYCSPDGSAWAQVGRALSEAAWGATANALGSPRSPFGTDEENSLTVFMTTGGDRLETVTQEALVNGANAALVLKASGEPEIIQFRDVTLNPDGSYTLRGLLRGRRGTDVFVEGHAAGELFVLLDPDDVETLVVSLGDLGLARSWRAVGFGTLFEDAEMLVQSHTGRDLKPYAPWNVKAVKSGSPTNITLSWVRRTRIGGELKDGTGTVPLGEASESYEVDILDGSGGALKRTLASTSPSVVYANADILADFGAVPASLSVAVYQLSAVAGRGFPRAVTLEVT